MQTCEGYVGNSRKQQFFSPFLSLAIHNPTILRVPFDRKACATGDGHYHRINSKKNLFFLLSTM